MSYAKFVSPHRRLKPITPRPNPQVSIGLHLRGGSGARETLARWQADYNLCRPHSALEDQAPAAFAAEWAMTDNTAGESPELLETVT